ncbi:uncharacterized protein BX663DRAFT_518815 [Cokeromyces recurvatus]|uniref:uncharacterized protein n=1 Tax=Cokeromyces recurvatus TaxID=90255 RepID=UPI002220CB17|nr:uncharacterized protein BX663DRAFT_522357 [Cokeromyces recurvatus]XP_051380150.1 uncharacterized protein BX663DRAFT_518815 [Cokeromyces recurvatus]KAI7899119.1 hypothetical protein BX663DRAFT_522357 [Cokeromyces recurvatus]KAI7900165.1 hypothetical protein BX663DRAFT_518815 [Cokeromyces recurvatus]
MKARLGILHSHFSLSLIYFSLFYIVLVSVFFFCQDIILFPCRTVHFIRVYLVLLLTLFGLFNNCYLESLFSKKKS